MFVVFHHILSYGYYLDPGYLPSTFKSFQNNNAILGVLIFFVISGTVIQLSNKQPISRSNLPSYFKKRALRIYPIYALSLVVALLVSKNIYSAYTIAGNFTFLNIMFSDVIWENGPIWSLQYEVLYYILFIPISYFNLNPIRVVIAAFLIGLFNFFLYPYTQSSLLTSYSFGFVFWVCGVIVVQYTSNKADGPIVYRRLISFLFLIVCLPFLNKIQTLIIRLSETALGYKITFPHGDVNSWFKMAINFEDFSYLPISIMLIILFSHYKFKYQKPVFWCLQLLPAYTLFTIFKMGGQLNEWSAVFALSCYILSFVFLLNTASINLISKKCFKILLWLGNISYGIYIIHMPILILFSQIFAFTGSPLTFSVRLIVYLALTILTARFLEGTYQRFILKFLNHQKEPVQLVLSRSD
jgi:peptidoglycan/LPS O-acetylase OafA/YrhL